MIATCSIMTGRRLVGKVRVVEVCCGCNGTLHAPAQISIFDEVYDGIVLQLVQGATA